MEGKKERKKESITDGSTPAQPQLWPRPHDGPPLAAASVLFPPTGCLTVLSGEQLVLGLKWPNLGG